jgi:hypothetical protein
MKLTKPLKTLPICNFDLGATVKNMLVRFKSVGSVSIVLSFTPSTQAGEYVSPIIRERYGSGLRGDLVVDGRYQRGWKDLALNAGVGLN